MRAAISDKTILISVMAANNEIGVLQPVREIGLMARDRGVVFHCDAVQALGKVPFDVNEIAVDLVSITAHKMYGPKGVGALYVRKQNRKLELEPLIDGGGHERGLRSGTLNVPGIVGFGRAAQIAKAELDSESERLRELRDRLLERLRARVPDLHVNGSLEHRLPNNLNVSFPNVAGEALLVGIGDICVSAGSACSSGSEEPPYVLKALALDPDLARASIRFGLGRYTTEEEVDYAAGKVADVVHQLRQMTAERNQTQPDRTCRTRPKFDENSYRPFARFRRRVHVLRPGQRQGAQRRPRARACAVGHRDPQSRRLRRHVRDLGRVVPCLRASDRQVHPAAARRQHGRQLRADGGGPQGQAPPRSTASPWRFQAR